MMTFRRWMREPVPGLSDEFTWGAVVLMFLGCIGIIALAML